METRAPGALDTFITGQLELREHETHKGLPLSYTQVQEIRRLAPKLDVRPSVLSGYDLSSTSWVGNLHVDGLEITVRPKVAMDRVLFLLSYSLAPEAWRKSLFDYGEKSRLLEAIAPGFIALTRRALARGLLRGYQRRESALQTVRGRLRFDDQIRTRYGRFPPAEVAYDEFTEDVAENRILRAAIERLGRLRPRSRPIRRDLRRLRSRLGNVSRVDYTNRPMPEISITRRNRHYRPALRLARLILRDSSISQRTGRIRSSSLLVDMNSVFEDFVVVALREALDLSARSFPQQARGRNLWLDREQTVSLQPDLSWWRGGRPVFVGDVKYKDLDEGGVRNEDLYQVLAYLETTGLDDGLLVYPVPDGQERSVVVRRSGRRIHVHGWSLDRSPERILEQVEETAGDVRKWSSSSEISGDGAARVLEAGVA